MAHFILLYSGESGTPPQKDVDLVSQVEGVTILDRSGRMVLVETTTFILSDVLEKLSSDWSFSTFKVLPLLDPRPQLKPGS